MRSSIAELKQCRSASRSRGGKAVIAAHTTDGAVQPCDSSHLESNPHVRKVRVLLISLHPHRSSAVLLAICHSYSHLSSTDVGAGS